MFNRFKKTCTGERNSIYPDTIYFFIVHRITTFLENNKKVGKNKNNIFLPPLYSELMKELELVE